MSLTDIDGVVLVGAGRMGLALARGWLNAGLRPEALTLCDPAPQDAATAFADEEGVVLTPVPPREAARVVVLAVKPQVMASVLPTLGTLIGPHTLVVSIAAGIALASLLDGLATHRVVRAMPNTPAQIGQGMTGAVAAPGVSSEDLEVAEALLAAAGALLWFDEESRIDLVTAVSGSGPAYVFYLVETLAAAGAAEGLAPEDAMKLARQTVIGAAALMDEDMTDAATLRQNVTSPNGTTAAALAVLMAPDGLAALMKKAVAAARKRAEELGR
ncbi:MAG: pyrroline-5-carboxylate reductase [Alphaproteobacteria bacterium]|nr:pyrroline-5-carboxylate reductase [Alphaproteobacteria bacterium]